MPTPQPGIFKDGHRTLHALEYALPVDAPIATLKAALARAHAALQRDTVTGVMAFGPACWAQLAPDAMPPGFQAFTAVQGPAAQAPATQRDICVWLHGEARDEVMDAALAVDHALKDVATRELDLPGFVYHDSRDLTGFVDGSANPKDDDAKRKAALVADGQPGAGGAFMLSQRWVHDLDAFNALAVPDQERVIGRTKVDSIELEGDAQPADSHVSRTDLKVAGVAQKMYRRSFPYGAAGEHGLYFLAFTCDQTRLDTVIRSMFGLGGDGVTDHLLSFTKPVTGSYWFAPSLEDLQTALA